MIPEDHFDNPFPRHPALEGMEEQRQIFGMENPDSQWILTDWDVWVENPFYHGPPQPHPEDYPHDDTEDEPTQLEQNFRDFALDSHDDCPF